MPCFRAGFPVAPLCTHAPQNLRDAGAGGVSTQSIARGQWPQHPRAGSRVSPALRWAPTTTNGWLGGAAPPTHPDVHGGNTATGLGRCPCRATPLCRSSLLEGGVDARLNQAAHSENDKKSVPSQPEGGRAAEMDKSSQSGREGVPRRTTNQAQLGK